MTITRASLETILVERCGALLEFAGKSVTPSGANPALNDPIGYALRQSGYSVSNPALVSNTDVSSIADDDFDMVCDYAELRTLKNIYGNLDKVDTSTGPYSQSYSQIRTELGKRIKDLQSEINDSYGAGTTIETGVINYDIADHNDTEITV